MCISAPSVPPPVAQRQGAQSPDAGSIATNVQNDALRRSGFAANIFTGSNTASTPAMTTGKSLLGM